MKFLCPACERLSDISAFRIEGTALVLTCSRCAASGRVDPPGVPGPVLSEPAQNNALAFRPSSDFETPPGDCCPKCIAPRPTDALVCGQCGLVLSNFDPTEHRIPEELTAAWNDLSSHWSDTAAHDRLIAQALGRGQLASVARLYRIRLARSPLDAQAAKGRDQIVERASAVSLQSSASGVPAKPRWQYAMLAVLAIAAIWMVVALMRALQGAARS